MPKLFTIKRTFYVYDGMAHPQYSEIEVTITNDSSTILDGEFVETSWFSDRECRVKTECTDEVPTDEQIEAWIRKSERADEVSSEPWGFEDNESN